MLLVRYAPCMQRTAEQTVPVPVLWWNSGFQCSEAYAYDCPVGTLSPSPACSDAAAATFSQLVLKHNVQIAAALYLFPRSAAQSVPTAQDIETGRIRPSDIVRDSVPHIFTEQRYLGNAWRQVHAKCWVDGYPDRIELLFAAGWTVLSSGDGCLDGPALSNSFFAVNNTERAFAVARVAPPRPFGGCPELCVLAVHMPHALPSRGQGTIRRVCAGVLKHCVVAFGDWDGTKGSERSISAARHLRSDADGREWVQADIAKEKFAALVPDSTPPSLALPGDGKDTCCFLCVGRNGAYDRLLTTVASAVGMAQVLDYPITEHLPVAAHKPVLVTLTA